MPSLPAFSRAKASCMPLSHASPKSQTRQILFLLPLIVIFPIFMGIDGVMYAGPIADGAAAVVCGYFTVRELRELKQLENNAAVN